MNAAASKEMAARRADLRARLQAQRLVIAGRLGVVDGDEGGYPRSATMRLLTQRPELIAGATGLLFSLFRARARSRLR